MNHRLAHTRPLVAVAHGSRDPRSAATMTAVVAQMQQLRPELDIRLAFLDLSLPRVPDVFSALVEQGYREAVVVPLLLGSAFHHRVDLPELVERSGLQVRIADVLGGDDRLLDVAIRRLRQAGVDLDDPQLGVALTAVGSSRATANDALRTLAARLPTRHRCAAFATAAAPDVATALSRLRAAGATRLAVSSWFLAPGLLLDRVASHADGVAVAAPLGADPLVAHVALDRYAEAVQQLRALTA